ncbi:MAG: hydantoinase/oxoprolinase family protein [Candidatus Thiodiazotropha weberae]|nr:hydantoinase/oxoprolinase family protein [Candidatus Thiodiazotropha lotti]MCG8011422.1 hydantoinase/oxoprolinase family protein [Candidatus Thiodiazotropha lotti]MCW4210887.1 hydantoinase/oxoprolinase family protein [Candidatus Thiodiazotropha lotti]MCW4215749.1 hydantoinase/oxoprolinase family protein [Candidatus Thiodiazotropha lotti]
MTSQASNRAAPLMLGVDTGGTFTDFVLLRGKQIETHKVLSTPQAPERAILQGIRELKLEPMNLILIHGSTVATNAALEGKGVRTLYIGNRGLADLLTIGRQARTELYNLQPEAKQLPVSAEFCIETGGRLGADGEVVEGLSEQDLAQLKAEIQQLAPQAVAINLLFSFLDDRFERMIEQLVPEQLFCSRSSEVLPASGEYERGIATWLNSWVGPLVAGYLKRLNEALPGVRLSVMQSSGEAIAADQAARQAVRMLLSGPAGGLVGAGFVAAESARTQLLTLDMGGTSTDVALIDGQPRLTREGRIGPWPVAVPMVDMHTIGAGGGSIARLDAGGMLLVGPESAGADPGPACYGRGGEEVTVTDANLLLGRLREDAFLGGRMRLQRQAAEAAVGRLAEQMSLPLTAVAEGIVRVANEHMAHALRVTSVQRGVDPRHYTLVSFGGAGGLHVCALADALGMSCALVPVSAGVLSALGMLATRPGRQQIRTKLGVLQSLDELTINQALKQLAAEASEDLIREGVGEDEIEVEYSLDLRYLGQSYTLNVAWQSLPQVERDFHRLHESRYGHRMSGDVELVNLRVALHGARAEMALPRIESSVMGEVREWLDLPGEEGAVPRYERAELALGQSIEGPALINEMASTTWLARGWRCEVDPAGNLLLERQQG